MAENAQNPELRRCNAKWGMGYYYVPKMFLSMNEISSLLAANNDRKLLENLRNVKLHHYEHMQVPIPVYNVKHCTEKMALSNICSEEGFRTSEGEKPFEFKNLSYWGADISSNDLETARQQAWEKVSRVINPMNPSSFEGELKEQFGNSLAFNTSVSRYGNFKFSFPLSYLLDLYKEQYCQDRKPQMRILCTEFHKWKMVHCIVVHSPDIDKFDDFPEVPTIQGSCDHLPFVYWMDGTLYWRPESTSKALTVQVSNDGSVTRCYQTYSVWNDLTLTFHLPNGPLKVPKQELLENLTACGIAKPYLGKEELDIKVAEQIVQQLKGGDENTSS